MRNRISKRRLKIMERRAIDHMAVIVGALKKEMEAHCGIGTEIVRVDAESEPGILKVWVNPPPEHVDIEVKV